MTDAEIERAVAELGIWLCPRAEEQVQRSAARDYLTRRGGRYPARAASEDMWSIAGALHRESIAGATVEVHELPVAGDGRLVHRGTVDEHGAFAFEIPGPQPSVVELHVIVKQAIVGRIGPVRTQPDTWVTWCEAGTEPVRPGRFEVQQRWLSQFTDGAGVVRDEVLAAHSGASIHDIRRHRWASELAPHVGGNSALAWVLLTRCCLSDEFDGHTWLDQAREALAAQAPAAVGAALDHAFAERFVARTHSVDAPNVAAAHRALRREVWSTRRPHPAGSTWREILDAVGLKPAHLEALPSLFDAGLDDVFHRLQQPDTDLPATVRARLAWVTLVRFDQTALARVGDDAPHVAIAKQPPAALAARLADAPEHRRHIEQSLEDQFPGPAVLWHLQAELGDGARPLFDAGLLDLDKLTVALWEGAHPSDSIPAARGTTVPIPAVSPEARTALMTHQRLLRIGKTKAATLALRHAGYDSAHAIASTPAATFASQMQEQNIEAPEAAALQARAVARQRATTSMFLESVAARRSFPTAPTTPTAATPSAAMAGLAALGLTIPASGVATSATATAAATVAATSRIPTLATLFGPLDYCECEDCESVVSLSAYLVDLLLWLSRVPLSQGSAYTPFNSRRPDVAQIELTCAGSETLVPHIDIVCELLEDRAAAALGPARIDKRQTIGTAAEIRAYPEHLNDAVYAKLADPTVFSWPFDHSLEEIRGYLGQIGSSRAAIMAVFGDATSSEYSAEVLGLSSSQLAILATTNEAAQPAIWGAAAAALTMEDLLRRGERVLGGALPYDVLVQVLQAPFLAQGRTLVVDLTADASGHKVDLCRADQRIVKYIAAGAPGGAASTPLDAGTVDRLHRALRLSRALGWDPREVCAVIAAFGTNATGVALDAAVLAKIAVARTSATDLGLAALDIALCFGPFSGGPSSPLGALYRSLFTVDGVLPQGKLGALAAKVGAALGVEATSITALITALGIDQADAGPDTLAVVYRHVRIVEAAGLTVADYLSRRALTPDPPFSRPDPAPLRAFVALDALLDRLGVDDARVRRLVSTDVEPDVGIVQLWAALVTARGRRPDATTATFVTDGVWREPIGTWLRLPGAEAVAALDVIAARFSNALATVVAWAFAGAVDLIVPPPRTPAHEAALRVLRRFGTLFELAATRPDLVAASNPSLAAFVVDGSWASLVAYLRFADAGSGSLASTRALFAAPPGPASAAAFGAALGLSTAAATALLANVLPALSLAEQWQLVARRVDLGRALKLPAEVVAGVALAPDGAGAKRLRDAYKSSIPRASWLATSAVVQNALRPMRRDALLAFLLANTGKSAQDCSDELLIDTLTGEGRDRSRIGEACAAVQTFVNRIFLGLDPALVRPEDKLWDQWIWRKRYALWKGNRMVFLFPENYLAAGKRPRTSPLFKNFQETVARGEINEANVSNALIEYLDGLTEIADLEYLAVGSDYNSNDDTSFIASRELTVVARTRGAPGRYYFSRLEVGVWSPFEELKLGEDPSHVALFSASGESNSPLNRYILVWPKTTLLPRPNQVPSGKVPIDGTVTKADMVLAVKYAWSERHGEADWSPVKTTSSSLLFDGAALTERQMLLSISGYPTGKLLPGEFEITTHYYKPPAAVVDRAPSSIGSMILRRDTTDKQVYNNSYTNVGVFRPAADPKDWSGPAPADDLLQQHISTRSQDLASPPPYGKRPWPNLRYDQNRMRSALGANGTRATPLVAPFLPDKVIITPFTPYSVTVLPWRNVGDTPYPSAWALFASGASWSFFIVQKDQFQGVPAEKLGKQALGLGPEMFGLAQPYAGVPAYHPFAVKLLALVKDGGLRALYDRVVQRRPAEALHATVRRYREDLGLNADAVFVPSSTLGIASAIESIDFSGLAPHANYNMELFFFAPLLIASNLRARGRYKESQSFFHYVFNPLEGVVPAGSGNPWWITPAFDNAERTSLEQIMVGAVGSTNPYVNIEASPFDAQAIAFGRRSAYQRFTVMEYLRNILDWADSLYAQLDLEDLDEAGQLYNLAASILGNRPLKLPPAGQIQVRTFNQPSDWSPSGNILAIENLVLDGEPTHVAVADTVDLPLVAAAVANGPSRLYFSIPRNDVLLGFYTRVEQALSNLRTCKSLGLNTTVDVQALVDAAAAGKASLYEALAPTGKNTLGPRFRVLVGKALELCNDARNLGTAVQSASERQDAEHLAALRSTWEGRIFDVTRAALDTRKREAQRELEALQASRGAAVARRDYYGSRERMNAAEEAAFGLNIAGAVLAGVSSGLEIAAAPAVTFPDLTIGVAGAFGSPVSTIKIGGSNIGGGIQAAARGIAAVGGIVDRTATMVATQAGYDRRLDDWQHQKGQAELELAHIDAQVTAALVRVQIANAELATNARQRTAWADQDEFLRTKYTTEDLYLWLLEQTNQLYARALELAMDMAIRAKATYQFELPDAPEPGLRRTWDATRRGALAADELAFSLHQMEADHLELDRYDVLVARRLSLKQLAPNQLIALRRTLPGQPASCEIAVPRWWLDRLDPGLHKRRIRSVAVSVACIGGPNASVNATFAYAGPTLSPTTSIRLSSGVNDRGWDSNSPDRYAPFEGVSLDAEATRWLLAFSAHTEIDVSTIADVVLSFEYTANNGAGDVSSPSPPWRIRLDLERDAPLAWQALIRTTGHKATLDPLDFLPAVLSEMTRASPNVTVTAVHADRSTIAGITGTSAGGTITLDGTAITGDWSQITIIYVDLEMTTP